MKHLISCRLPFFVLTFIALSFGPGTKYASASRGSDLTRNYHQIDDSILDHNLKALKDVQVLFVPGIFSEFVDFFSCYFCEFYSALESLGLKQNIDFKKMSTQTESSVKTNIPIIKDAIEKSDRPVILVSHSKGSVEVLETLIKYPKLTNKVKAWISIQGAIKGSFFADGLTNKVTEEKSGKKSSWSTSFLQQFYDLVMIARAGNNQALLDLRTEHRNEYLLKNQKKIADLNKAFPILSVASHAEFKDLPLNYRIGQNQLGKPTAPNDGLIETTHHILPGSDFITFKNTHHNMLVAKSYGKDQDLIFKRLLSLVIGDGKSIYAF